MKASDNMDSAVKHCCKLRTALKYRQAQHRALIIGIQMLEEVASISAALQPLKIHTLLVAQASQPPAGEPGPPASAEV